MAICFLFHLLSGFALSVYPRLNFPLLSEVFSFQSFLLSCTEYYVLPFFSSYSSPEQFSDFVPGQQLWGDFEGDFSNFKLFLQVDPTDYMQFEYKCHTCLLGFKRRGMLVNHLAKRHPNVDIASVPELNQPILKATRCYYCQYCDKVCVANLLSVEL